MKVTTRTGAFARATFAVLLISAAASACIWDSGNYQGGGRKSTGVKAGTNDSGTDDAGSTDDAGYDSGTGD